VKTCGQQGLYGIAGLSVNGKYYFSKTFGDSEFFGVVVPNISLRFIYWHSYSGNAHIAKRCAPYFYESF
jgi:hypothetical protein